MRNKDLSYGLIAGTGVIAWFLLFYGFDKPLMLSPYVYYASFALYLWAMYRAMRWTYEQEGEPEFKAVLRSGFVVYLTANLLYYLFYYFIHQLDPQLTAFQKEMMREWLPRITPRDKLQKALEALESSDFSVKPGDALFSYVRSAIGGFLLAAGLAWIVLRTTKKN